MKERLKTISIIFLIIMGITQVGILWSYQSQGTPTGFFTGLFGLKTGQVISDKVVRERLFEPDRLILSDGSSSYWIVGDNRREYSALWNEAKNGLNKIVSGDAKLTKLEDSWGSVAEKRGALIDFGYVMNSELLAWLLGAVNPSQDIPDIRKVMINRDITNEYTSIFYIYSSDGTVYSSQPIRYDEAMNLFEVIDNVSLVSRKYSSLAAGKIAKENDEPDVLYAVAQYWRYNELSLLPAISGGSGGNGDELASVIIGAEKDRYNKRIISGNTIQFSYGDNIYRYYEDGYMTYRYLRDTYPSGKGQIGKALLNAYKFIAEINDRIENTGDIALTSVKSVSEGVYEFGFDYKAYGMPVRVNIDSKDVNSEKLDHAIIVQADSSRVLKCDWLLRTFAKGGQSNYNDRFIDLLESAGKFFPDLSIQDVYTCYVIDSSGKELLKPVLLIKIKGEGDLVIEMIAEKGD
jgi:hypothetical protein